MRGVSSTITQTKYTSASRGFITPNDHKRILQLVGFVEYGNALNHFIELLRSSTAEELEAMDQIVQEKPEFTVYSNLASQFERGPSTLSRPVESTTEGNRGLAWVIALARTEYGAMLAGFSDAPSPFLTVPLHDFDRVAFQTLLLDGAISHYWGLVSDPSLKRVTRTSPSNPIVLAYSRRLVVARSMMSAAMRLAQRDLSNIQLRELTSWKESMDEVQAGLIASIQLYLQASIQSTTKASKQSSDYVEACGAMLRAEKRELAAGTAVRIP